MKKRGVIFVSLFSVFLVALMLVSASFELGELSIGNSTIGEGYDIDIVYGPGGTLSGKINISLDDEDFDSDLVADFEDSNYDRIEIKEFLDNNDIDYDCSTADCGMTYLGSAESAGKTISMVSGSKRTIGIKFSGGDISSVNGFSLGVSSDVASSCSNPLKIDIIDDGSYEWTAHQEVAGEFCSSNDNYGCYVDSQKENDAFVTLNQYCNRINVSASPKIQVGADLVGSVSASFVMNIFNDNFGETCEFDVSSSGEQGCIVDISTTEEQEFEVCINVKDSDDMNKYTIGTENNNACGYIGDTDQDFAIFARPAKYEAVGNFDLTTDNLQAITPALGENTEIESYILDYLEEVYDRDCSDDCYVPIRLVSGTSQTIVLSDFSVFYEGSGISIESTNLYDLSETKSQISMDFTELDISRANLIVPTSYGDYDLMLGLGGENLFDERLEIEIVEAPIINLVYPQKVPAGIDISFKAYVSGSNVTKYSWDFGANASQETTMNTISYKYSAIGTYDLEIEVENSLGASKKTFTIKVISPGEYMDEIFNQSQKNLASAKTKVSSFDSFTQSYIDETLDLDTMETELAKLKVEYEGSSGATSEYVDILNDLEALNIPEAISSSKDSSKFVINKQIVNFDNLQLLGAGSYLGTQVDLKSAVFQWFIDSLNVMVEKETYSITFDANEEVFATKFKFKLVPIKPLGSVFFVVNADNGNLKFKESTLSSSSAGQSTGIVFESLNSARDVEFMLATETDILTIPAYLAPGADALSQYLVGGLIDVDCNNDGVCQSNEHWKTCRTDCKPWGWIFFWLFILLLIVFIIYIILQEWYKRKYEAYLFKNKNDLYNLMNFIDNALKQGLSREQIFAKLLTKGWNKEQIVYAWRKLKGKRTGMWEIPTFGLLDRLTIKKELDKRRKAGVSGKITPIPGAAQHKPLPGAKPMPTGAKPMIGRLNTKPLIGKPNVVPNKQNLNKPKFSLNNNKKK